MSVASHTDDTRFVPTKVHHLVYYVMQRLKREVGAIELMKIIFLIDVAYFRLFGRSLTGLQYVRHEKGPYAREISDAAEDMDTHELSLQSRPCRGSSQYPKKARSLGEAPRFEAVLAPDEAQVVDETLHRIGGLRPKELEEQAYSTEPMRAMLEQEATCKQKLVGRPLDLLLLQRDSFMLQWLKNREAREKVPPDDEYERLLAAEKRDFELLLNDV